MSSILIIGSGFAGIGMAIRLKQAGIDSFTILERADDVGGTWRDNDYPGCACDVQSHLYSFSFEQNPKWTRMFAPQKEILEYLRHCTEKYDLRKHMRFGENVARCDYDEKAGLWTVRTSAGHEYRARSIVSGMGALSNPAMPNIPGMDRFQGKTFHSATWDHAYDLAGKRVAVIGTGASAIQFVPQIAPKVAKMDLYQRTPPWLLPKPDRPIAKWERSLFHRLPVAQKLFRSAIYLALEIRVLGLVIHPKLMKHVERAALGHIANQVPSAELRAKVTPDYTIGCKRILLSDDWYPAISRENVNVVSTGIREITERGVVTDDGTERPVDAIIYGTGFHVQSFIPKGRFFGRGGVDVVDAWKDGPEAYKSTTVAGFPNLFLLAGPNSGLGHTSMVFMIESQIAYVLDAIRQMKEKDLKSVEVRKEVQTAFNEGMQAKHKNAVWQTGCKSWYLDANGRNTTIWPDFTFRFRRLTAHFDAADYRLEPHAGVGEAAAAAQPPQRTRASAPQHAGELS